MDLRKKVIGVPLQKAIASEDGAMLVRGFFTSDQKDEVGDIITRSATERALPKYKRWGNIRYMHLPKPVGKVARIGEEDGLAWNEVEIKVIDPAAKFEVEHGLLQALSVGILIAFDDLDMMEDGGWLINDYTLAEISLVDHPANYDAALETLNLSLDSALREKIREQGVVPVLRSIGALPAEKGEQMPTDTNDQVIEEVKAVEEEQPVLETQEVETPEVDTPEIIEESKDITDVDQVADGTATEEVVAEVTEEVPAEVTVDPVLSILNSLADAISGIQAQLEELTTPQEVPVPEADVESVEDAKDIGGGDDDRVAQLESKVAELTAKIESLVEPVDRKGAVPTEEIVETVETKEDVEPEPRPKNLSEAVGLYMKGRKTAR